MNFRRNTPEEPELNLIPMMDVLIILLIFLVLTTTFEHRLQLGIQLPSATTSKNPAREEGLRVAISQDGHYHVLNETLDGTSASRLAESIQRAADMSADPLILIDADQASNHQALMTLLDALNTLGYHRIGFETNRTPDK